MIETECLAISFEKKDQCYLFKTDFEVDNNSTGWISYIKAKKMKNMRIKPPKHLHNMNNVYHEIDCWEECLKDFKCEGISLIDEIGLKPCYIFRKKKGYSMETKENWVSYLRSKAFVKDQDHYFNQVEDEINIKLWPNGVVYYSIDQIFTSLFSVFKIRNALY